MEFRLHMRQDGKRRLSQQIVIVVALPVFVLLSAHRRETLVVDSPSTQSFVQGATASEHDLAAIESGCTSSERGPLRILNFIARAAKSTRRRDEAGAGLVRIQPIIYVISNA